MVDAVEGILRQQGVDSVIHYLDDFLLVELRDMLQSWLERRSCCRRKLESPVGKLAHASTVVKPGRKMMRQMFELLARRCTWSAFHIRLSQSFKSDLQWQLTFVEE